MTKKAKKKAEEVDGAPAQIDSSSKPAKKEEKAPEPAPATKKSVKGMAVKQELQGEDSEPAWKALCIKNFDFIQQAIEQNKYPDLTPGEVAHEADF